MKISRPLVAASCFIAKTAFAAAPCGRPDLLETYPADGATDVPINARLSAHYAPSAEYVDEEVTLEHVGVGTETPRVTFDASEGFVAFQPSESLVPGDTYVVRWPALRGLTTAATGKGAEVRFTAGGAMDVDAPLFVGARAVAWDVERIMDDCTDALEDRFVFDVSIGDATDDGGREMLALLVFQSKGGNATASPAPVLTQRFAGSGSSVRVQRSLDSAAGNVCFAALVRDGTGRVSSSADREVCVATVRPPFFYGCSLARSGEGETTTRATASLATIALLLFTVKRRAIRRGRPRG